ncbi:MAG: ABC transporter substrate-binding protein [Treponema sp.]|jgi:peptide/nickel transport system substrate-binding protein|nr:ABC transporter substrate-binding protein [Treponema sp.]
MPTKLFGKAMPVLAAGALFFFVPAMAVNARGALPQAAPSSAVQDTFIIALEGDPGNDINTITTSGRYDLSLERMLYSPLLNYYGPNDITYLLAESVDLSSSGPTVATYHLRKGVVWSDGAPFTADDVIFTFEHIVKADYANGHDNFVFDGQPVTFVKQDDYTVELRYPVFVSNPLEAASAEHFIMPKHIYAGDATLDNNPKNQKPVGTGPYKLAEYAAGQYVKLVANDTYFLGKPKIPNMILQIVSDLNAAKLALQKGEIHALSITVSDAESLKSSGLNIYAYPEDRVGYLCVNLTSPRVQDINLRKALFFALNRNEMNIGAYVSTDYYANAYSILPYANPFFTDDLEKYEQDLNKARQYLAQVSGAIPVIRFAYTANNPQQEVQAMVAQQNLRAIGVTVELQGQDAASLQNKLMDHSNTDFELFLGGYIMGIDPGNYQPLFFSTAPYNYARLNDAELDQLWIAGSVEADAAKRVEIYHEIQRHIADLAAWYPIVTNKRILGVTSNIGGIEDARLIPIYTFEDMSKLYFK